MKLTPNRRMAAFLQSKGHADALPLNLWLEQIYAQLSKQTLGYPYCLSAHEEEIVWEKIISLSESGQLLLKTAGIARLAKDAWYLCSHWQIPFNILNNAISEDSRVYQDWALNYQEECQRKNWVDFANILEHIMDAIHKKHIELPQEITLMGFEEITPQLNTFLNNIQQLGCKVQFLSLILGNNGQYNRIEAKNNEEEFRLAARMVNQWIEKSPESLIGIVVPELEKQRSLVIRVFEEMCSVPFNVSAPLALDCYPLVDTALLALSILSEEIPLEKFSKLLRSPFLGYGISQMASKAALDVAIRSFKEREFSAEKLVKRIRQISVPSISKDLIWLNNLIKFLEKYTDLQSKQSAMQWKNILVDLLGMLGWPGERSLTSEEIQIQQQWSKLLEIYVSMGALLGAHSYREAVFQLARLAKATLFLPATPNMPDMPVQILGVLEATGLPFDYLWITGLHREAWPTEPSPNPFIPIAIQRARDLPRSSAVRELKVAKRFTEQFCKSAKQIIFSYPAVIEERVSTASALIAPFPEISREALGIGEILSSIPLALTKKTVSKAFPAYALQNAEGKQRLPIEAGKTVSGGTNLLKLQALCPFRAFAEIRLRATPLPEIEAGLDGKDRGEIIHYTLHYFWEDIPNQTTLQSFSTEALNDKIEKAFEKAIIYWQDRYFINLTPRYLALEKKRTCDLLYQLCELEKARPYFEVVAREEEKLIDLQGLQIKIRIDRIDKTQNQEELLIDYKTGQVSISGWFQDRPQDPQLPLYCISRDPKPMGIVFSIVRADGVRFQGLTREEKYLPGVKTVAQLRSMGSESTWEEQCTTWQNTLELLAKDFKEGLATVDPVDGENTCRVCSLKSLCRVKSAGLQQ